MAVIFNISKIDKIIIKKNRAKTRLFEGRI
jgi:hypothetical protein